MTADYLELAAHWLAFSRNREIPIGISRGKALSRAAELIRSLTTRTDLGPESGSEDESKDVAYGLVELLAREADGEAGGVIRKADLCYRHIRGLQWIQDEFDERRALLRRCAELGWRSVGVLLARVEDGRRQSLPGQAMSFELPDPSAAFRLNGQRSPTTRRDPYGPENSISPKRLLVTCTTLMQLVNSRPELVAEQGARLYEYLATKDDTSYLFDEKDYLLGAVAYLTGAATRHLRRLDQAERWLDISEFSFRETTEAIPLLLRVECERLALLADSNEYRKVCMVAPKLAAATARLGMFRDNVRVRIIEAEAQKHIASPDGVILSLFELSRMPALKVEPIYEATVYKLLGDCLSLAERFDDAEMAFAQAADVGQRIDWPFLKANLYASIGFSLSLRHKHRSAASLYEAAAQIFQSAGISSWAAYIRILLADALVGDDRHQEAAGQILIALPVIEREQLTKEAWAATTILRDSVDRKKIDPTALRKVKEHLRGILR